MLRQEESLVQKYLNQGGTVEKINPRERSEEIEYTGGFYQRRKKKQMLKNKEEDNG